MLKKILFAVIAVISIAGPVTSTAANAATSANTAIVASQLQGLPIAKANAVRMAKDYLRYSAFSRSGLIDQLKYEGFSTRIATFAVDYITVSWKNQAYRMAKDYLRYSAFSRTGLIEQLRYEGFTALQAAYGANRAFS